MARLSIDAPDRLQLAGLRRAAEEVGLVEASAGEGAEVPPLDEGESDIGLRAEGSGSPHPLLDVVVQADRVRIGVSRAPDAETWERLRQFIDVLLGSQAPHNLTPPKR
ncbi:MAG TPA: hypothetical protein VGP46_14680 [Acidimicrobiales bacterium]|jgi:hypothetical protein|nr:hypothetical protein [Acidimicrobiales bacterium]